MDIKEIISNVKEAVNDLISNEKDVLQRKLFEQNLSHHLAKYLEPLFEKYNVDIEFNGDIDKPNDRKALEIAQSRMIRIGYNSKINNTYNIRPDIIVHRRGDNENNILVVEIKKDISPDNDKEYDLIKLEHLTIDYLKNHYNYRLGVAIILGTGEKTGEVDMILYQEGNPVQEKDLK